MGRAYSDLSPADLSRAAHLAIDNALADAEIVARLAPYGYPEAELQRAAADVKDLDDLADDQLDAYADQAGTTAALNLRRERFHADPYMPHLTLARVEFEGADDVGARKRLGLDGARAQGFHDWLRQARRLYHGLRDDAALGARMAARGLPASDVTAAAAELDQMDALEEGQEDRKGLAQQSTRDRDELKGDVAKWMSTYEPTCEVALRDRPEWLERLGFLHRTDDPPDLPA